MEKLTRQLQFTGRCTVFDTLVLLFTVFNFLVLSSRKNVQMLFSTRSFVTEQRSLIELCAGKEGGGGHKEMGVLDLGKAAKLLTDIAAVEQEADLSGIDVISLEAEFLSTTRSQVREQAQVFSLATPSGGMKCLILWQKRFSAVRMRVVSKI